MRFLPTTRAAASRRPVERGNVYNLTVDRTAVGMTPAVYSIVVHSQSTSGTFNDLAVVRVTLQ